MIMQIFKLFTTTYSINFLLAPMLLYSFQGAPICANMPAATARAMLAGMGMNCRTCWRSTQGTWRCPCPRPPTNSWIYHTCPNIAPWHRSWCLVRAPKLDYGYFTLQQRHWPGNQMGHLSHRGLQDCLPFLCRDCLWGRINTVIIIHPLLTPITVTPEATCTPTNIFYAIPTQTDEIMVDTPSAATTT